MVGMFPRLLCYTKSKTVHFDLYIETLVHISLLGKEGYDPNCKEFHVGKKSWTKYFICKLLRVKLAEFFL